MTKPKEKTWCKVCGNGMMGQHTCSLDGPIQTTAFFHKGVEVKPKKEPKRGPANP